MPKYTIHTDRLTGAACQGQAARAVTSLKRFIEWLERNQPAWTRAGGDNQSEFDLRVIGALTNIAENIGGHHKVLDLAIRQANRTTLDPSGAAIPGTTRAIGFTLGGDLLVEYGDAPAPGASIKLKVCATPSSSDVDAAITQAAMMFSGADLKRRRIVDITITNRENPWPNNTGVNPDDPFTVEDLRKRVDRLVQGPLRRNNDWMALTPDLGKRHDARPAAVKAITRLGTAIDFVVKIRWNHHKTMVSLGKNTRVRRVATLTDNVNGTLETKVILTK